LGSTRDASRSEDISLWFFQPRIIKVVYGAIVPSACKFEGLSLSSLKRFATLEGNGREVGLQMEDFLLGTVIIFASALSQVVHHAADPGLLVKLHNSS